MAAVGITVLVHNGAGFAGACLAENVSHSEVTPEIGKLGVTKGRTGPLCLVDKLHGTGDLFDNFQVVSAIFQELQDTICVLVLALVFYRALSELLEGAFNGGRTFFRILSFAVLANIGSVPLGEFIKISLKGGTFVYRR